MKFALIALIGGIGTIIGPVIGALLIMPLESYLRAELGGAWAGRPPHHARRDPGLAALFLQARRRRRRASPRQRRVSGGAR